VNSISANYFRTLKIPLRRGRDFSAADTERSQPVAIVSELLARKYWPHRDPVGQRIRLGDAWTTIVRVVGDVRAWANAPPSLMLYRPYQQTASTDRGPGDGLDPTNKPRSPGLGTSGRANDPRTR
jgi:hypothetical protein